MALLTNNFRKAGLFDVVFDSIRQLKLNENHRKIENLRFHVKKAKKIAVCESQEECDRVTGPIQWY